MADWEISRAAILSTVWLQFFDDTKYFKPYLFALEVSCPTTLVDSCGGAYDRSYAVSSLQVPRCNPDIHVAYH